MSFIKNYILRIIDFLGFGFFGRSMSTSILDINLLSLFGLYEILKSSETYYNGPWQDNNEGIERIIFGPDLSTLDFTEYT